MPQCRCSRCEARRTLPKAPAAYLHPPRCKSPGCKSRQWRVDRWRLAHEVGKNAPRPCRCDEYAHPHRKGSGWCIHNDSVTDDDRKERWENGYRYRKQLHG